MQKKRDAHRVLDKTKMWIIMRIILSSIDILLFIQW